MDSPADLLFRKAEKKARSWGFFTFDKWYNAEELFLKAANAYRREGNWKRAAESFRRAAKCCRISPSGNGVGIANSYKAAALCYKNHDEKKYIKCMIKSASAYETIGLYTVSGNWYQEMARHLYKKNKIEQVIKYYEIAMKLYKLNGGAGDTNNCIDELAQIYALSGNYMKAAELFDQLTMIHFYRARQKYLLVDYVIQSIVCLMAGRNITGAEQALNRYIDLDPRILTYQSTNLLKSIINAIILNNLKKYDATMSKWNNIERENKFIKKMFDITRSSIDERLTVDMT